MKIVAVSDMHSWYEDLKMPKGDVLVVAGDIELYDSLASVHRFVKWIKKQKYEHKIVVGGNHDRMLAVANSICKLALMDHCTYLENSEYVINGIKFWGSPNTPVYGSWFFMKERGDEISRVWEQIPDDVDVLITHGPPYKILDKVLRPKGFGEHVGCYDLARFVAKIKPKVHIFGHIHEGYGMVEKDGTKYYNVSVFNEKYQYEHEPTVIEI